MCLYKAFQWPHQKTNFCFQKMIINLQVHIIWDFCVKVCLNIFIHLFIGTISNLNLIVLQVSNTFIIYATHITIFLVM